MGEERIGRKKAEITVLMRRKMRLEQQYEHHVRGIKDLDMQMARLQAEMGRLNTLIAKNSEIQKALESDTFNLESKIMLELRELESQAARLEGAIETAGSEKQDLMATLVETERQVCRLYACRTPFHRRLGRGRVFFIRSIQAAA